MGNGGGCMNTKHLDHRAVTTGGGIASGGDIDAAVLASTNFAGQGGSPTQKLQLSFRCENLPNMDTMSYSDPFAVMYKQQGNIW